MAKIPFVREMEFEYGAVDRVAPNLRLVIAENPSKFTYRGTGTYVVGDGEVAVIDPGPDRPEHLEALLTALEGETVSHILVTHTHRDHSPLSRRLRDETGAPVWGCAPHDPHEGWPDDPDADALTDDEEDAADGASADGASAASGEGVADGEGEGDGEGDEANTERGFDADHVPDRQLSHGDVVEGSGWRMEAVHTPGHTSNHLCFALDDGTLFTGDHVMGWSTSVISPPDGDMQSYLGSLRLLLDRDDRVYRPTHGPPITDPVAHVEAFLVHRLEREHDIVELLGTSGPSTIADLVPTLYADVDTKLHKAAGRSVHSHLLRLHGAGAVDAEGDPRLLSLAVWRVAR